MFYSETILTNKHSPIGIAWLLATLGPKNQARKISRKELIAFDLVQACGYISEPPEPLALRTSATLLYGVAKVYNQHFEEFFTNVNTFHHTLRRTIITDFSTTGNGGTGGTRGIDLSDEGKSKIDQITFGGIDLGWQSGLDFSFGIDWFNPLDATRKRRNSSKLDSQPSQQSEHDEEEEEGYESEDSQGVMRKRPRSSSTPGHNDHIRKSTSIHHASDRITPLGDDFMPPLDLQLGLDDVGQHPDTSFSAPGEAFADIPGDFNLDQNVELDFGVDRMTPQREVRESSVDSQGNLRPPSKLKSAMKKRRREDDSSAEVEAELEQPKTRVKKQKKVKWDQSLELADEDEATARRIYREHMEVQRKELMAKEQEKVVQGRADEMVDSAGGWLEFFDPEMQVMFASITKTGKFKWELDLAAHRLGKQYIPEDEHEQVEQQVDPIGFEGDRQEFGADDPFGPSYAVEQPYADIINETFEDVVDPTSKPRRSESTDVEMGRRASQGSHISLPWHDKRRESTDDDFYDAPDSGFTPGSLRFSLMTPQEARIRRNSRSKSGLTSSQQPIGGLGLDGRRGRSRSGSVLQDKAMGPPAMLYGPDDDSLPQDVLDLAEEPSQYREVPDAFRPEALATIESQCRNFLTYVEERMVAKNTDEVDFDDVVNYKTSKKVAAIAFYNCLTLATKNILKVDQAEAFDSFSIRFASE